MAFLRSGQGITLLTILGLWLFLWLTDGWVSSGGVGLPLVSKAAFAAAVLLYGNPALEHLACEPGEARWRRLRLSVLHGVHYFLLMIIITDVPLPSVSAGVWLPAAGIFGAIMGYMAKPPSDNTVPAATGFRLFVPAILALIVVALTFLPIITDHPTTLFVLILALGMAGPVPNSMKDLRTWDWVVSALAVIAALTGLFTAP